MLLATAVLPLAAQHGAADAASSSGSEWWAYRPLARPEVPQVEHPFVAGDIDRFILDGLGSRGLEPSPPATPEALIRRLTYDLTGLPPTPEEVEAFVADHSPEAYTALVERLLASPQYGVKWGRHWLDLVRYAETNSFERDSKKPAVWRYRDWVISAFNDDLPWAQFLTMQLAGDELPERSFDGIVATGYYRLGLWDDEPTYPLQAIYDDYDSIADTTGRAMLVISIGCARCHDHKKDPITQRDYYSFLSFFEGINPYRPNAPGNRMSPQHYSARVPVDGAQEAYDRQLADYNGRHDTLKEQAREVVAATYRRLGAKERVQWLEAADRGLVAQYSAENSEPTRLVDDVGEQHGKIEGQIVPVPGKVGTGLRFDGDDRAVLPRVVEDSFTISFWVRSNQPGSGRTEDPRWFQGDGLVDGEISGIVRDFGISWLGDGRVCAGVGDPETFVSSPPGHADGEWHHVAFTRDRKTGRIALYVDGMLGGSAKGNKHALDAPPRLVVGGLQPGGRGFKGEMDELRFYDRALSAAEVVALSLDVPGGLAATAAMIDGGEGADIEAMTELASLRLPELETAQVLCVTERKEPPPSYIRLRGNANTPGDEVMPALPAVFAADVPPIEDKRRSSGRRTALAEWIVSPDNPLTWRVLANRLWQHHFGRGLSRTSNDFGRLGMKPTHPELLDWLATEILRRGGSLKSMHRLIVHSSSYRMACAVDEAKFEADPLNDLFWRFDRRRLAAEEVRDSILAASGRLNLKMGGPSIYPPLPAAVLATASRPGAGWGRSSPEESARRSVYVHVKRSLLEPLLTAFDMADTDASCPERFSTVQPTQALTLLNSDFAQSQAREFAARLEREAGDLRSRIERGLWLATSRQPSAVEVDRLVRFCEELQRDYGRTERVALERVALILLNCNEFMYLD